MTVLLLLPFDVSHAQVSVEWAVTYSGPAPESADAAYAIVVDQVGNVYVTGGSGVILTESDYATIKYNQNGDSLWVRRYNDSTQVFAGGVDIALDRWGNVYVTGVPFTIKYDSSGNQLWVTNNDVYNIRIALDDTGHIYVAGTKLREIYTTKLDTNGTILWQARFPQLDPGGNEAYDMVLDPRGNVIVVGEMYVPGGNHYDYITLKYSPQGDTLWTRSYNGAGGPSVPLDIPYAVAVDALGNIYVTGMSRGMGTGTDYLTIKYSADGDQRWTARYNGPNNAGDAGYDIAVDREGNVYVTGITDGYNYTTLKYDSTGVLLWSATYPGSGPTFNVIFPKLTIDSLGYVYATVRGADGQWNADFAMVKYDPDGNTVWVATYPRPGDYEVPNAIALDGNSNVYLAGWVGLGSLDADYLTVKFSQEPVSVNDNGSASPQAFKLYQNYPNPFNSTTTIPFSIPTSTHVRLQIFNILGQEVATLVNERLPAGDYRIKWDAQKVPSGIYWYRLQTDAYTESKKLLLLK